MNKTINFIGKFGFALPATLFFSFLLVSPVFSQSIEAPQPAPQELSLFELLLKGGPVMIPIVLLFICATYLAIERYLYIRSVTKGKSDLMSNVQRYILNGDIKTAKMITDQDASATGKIIGSGIDYIGKPFKDIESVMESAANIEVARMEKNLGYLGVIAGVAPMLGFVGTIAGIIHIFYNISLADNINIGIIAGGLYEKMITSGSGLVVGVIAYTAYHLLHQKINAFTLQVQRQAFDFIRLITSPAS